jgi:hypothetical protein
MVSGDIDAPAPNEPVPDEAGPEPIEAEAFEDRKATGFSEAWLAPEVFVDDFDDVSALRASIADEAAPKAKNMAELQQCRMEVAADNPVRFPQQTPCHQEKPNKIRLSCISCTPAK